MLPQPLALELFQHIPGWLAHLAEKVAPLFFGEVDPHGPEVAALEVTLYGWVFVVPTLLVSAVLGTREMKRIPSGLQNVLESVVGLLDGFAKSIIGEKHYLYFANYVGAAFIFIHANNAFGMIPGMGSATSVASTTLALALCSFVVTHYAGVRFSGIKGYAMHFVGEPKALGPLMVPIHICGELARPLSLCLRLMGNIGGEEKALAIFVSLGLATGLFLPVQTPLIALGVLTTFIQAVIFCLLTCVYVAGTLPHEHHHDHGHGHDHGHAHQSHAHAPHGHGPAPAPAHA
jgi:F-type H+-transporting ATPase subunit a